MTNFARFGIVRRRFFSPSGAEVVAVVAGVAGVARFALGFLVGAGLLPQAPDARHSAILTGQTPHPVERRFPYPCNRGG